MATIRYLAQSGRTFTADIFDGNDYFLESVAFSELPNINGVYRADTSASSSDMWALIKDSSGVPVDMIRIEPRIGSVWSMPDALNIWRYLGLK